MIFLENESQVKTSKRAKKQTVTLVEIYKEFKSRKLGIQTTKEEFIAICKDFMQLCHDAMLYEGFEFNPKCNLGRFSIRQRKLKLDRSLKVDFHKTKIARKETGNPEIVIYHMNNHTGNYYYYHHWKKGNCTGVMMWVFKATFENRRAIAAAIIEKRLKPYKPKITSKTKIIR